MDHAHHQHDADHSQMNHASHDKHEGHSPEMFRQKFWLSLVFTVPVILYSMMVQEWLGFRMPSFTGSHYVSAVFGTILFFYSGTVFIKGAVSEIKDRLPGMMTLISLAIIVAFAYSLATTFIIQGSEFFWELATLITIMIFGHWMEMRSVMSAQGALNELAKLLPDEAELVVGSDTKKVPVAQLKVGDVVLVRPGAQIPADGKVVGGESNVNEAMITGESQAVGKQLGSLVIAGTVNGDGALRVEVTKLGDDTALAGIMRLVAEAQSSKSRAQILADQAAFYLTIVALSAGILTLIGWLVAGQTIGFALERMVTVLVIACPHALGLAVPLVTSISTTLAARNGLLVRQRLALESARNVDVVLFDKTGTLTKGEQGVVDVWGEATLELAASVGAQSEHSISQAIVAAARERKISLPATTKFKALPGRGVQAVIGGELIMAGGPELLKEFGLSVPKELVTLTGQAAAEGKSIIYVVKDKTVIGALAIADVIRPESKLAVQKLRGMGIRVAMLTGDADNVAAWVSKELGIKEYFAQVLPELKADAVKKLQADGSRVAMVGDGVNDAPALTQADIGIAIGAGTDVAIEAAGIVLASSDPGGVIKIIGLSKASYRKMVQNLIWATGYNALAIPLAAGVFASFGLILAPAFGAILMSLSTIIVALNAQFLRRLKLEA